MNNTSNSQQDDDEVVASIAPLSVAALSNPQIKASQYWNLTGTSFGAAGFGAAWGYATGHGIVISVVDEGVNYTHLDLSGNYDQSLDFDPRDDASDYDARPDTDIETHGTEVAGVIAGAGGNSIGTIGAAPDATITASYLRYGSGFDIDDLAQIMAHQAAYDVSNNSWGFTTAFADNFNSERYAAVAAGIETAATTGRGGLGTAMVFAAGNGRITIDGQNLGDDSNFHNVANSRFAIAVGAHDSEGESAFFSSPGTNILVSAPGVGLITTAGDEDGAKGSSHVSGTSFAAPMVSSAIALMLEVNPNLGYRDIQEILAVSADPSRSGVTTTNGAGNVNGGGMVFDREMGFGALNAASAVALARSWTLQHDAANEQHIGADFDVSSPADPLSQTFTVDVANPGTDGFSLDFVELSLDVSDADLRDLRIELVSPDGTVSLIAPNLRAAGSKTSLDFTFSSVETWGENPYGTWTVKLSHPTTSDSFDVKNLHLDLYGDDTGANGDYYFTASYARLVAADASRSVVHDIDGGTDRLNFAAAAAAVTVDLGGVGASSVGKTGFTLDGGFENVWGSVYADHVTGSDDANSISGDFGNDWIAGLGGDDVLSGNSGDDTILGGDGADAIDGGDGFDIVVYEHAVTLDFVTNTHTGDAAGDTFVRIEEFSLSDEDDFFYGSLAAVNDRVLGNGGTDHLDGGAGDDWLDGGAGADVLVGGTGNDTFVIDSPDDVITELTDEGIDTVRASFDYTLTTDLENLTLTGKARNGTGTDVANVLVGNSLANHLYGLGGADSLSGGTGRDSLYGGSGADSLMGGSGADVLRGGAGADTFFFTSRSQSTKSSHDKIMDFRHGTDTIDLSGIDASTHAHANNAFKFIGSHGFGHKAGQLRIDHTHNTTLVLGDTNGDGHTDFEIVFRGHVHLTAGDFVL